MELTYPPEAEEFRKEIRTWLEENLPEGWFDPDFELSAEERKAFNEEWPRRLYEGGWICASWPEEYGGKALTVMENVVLAEEFARAKAPIRADFFGDTLVGPTILQWGTEEQKKEFLPPIQQGEMRWCQGFSEPDSGSDLASLKTTAVLDGEQWVINGQKVWTTQAQHADYIFLLARTDQAAAKHHGISYLLVPMRQDGIEVRPITQPDGTAEFNEVFFDNAHCPKDNVVGGVNNGWVVANTTLAHERGMSATTSYRRFAEELALMIAAARDRGRLADPLVRQRLMRYHTKIEILRINGLRALSAAVQGGRTPAWRRSVRPTRCSGPRCTATPWSWRSTSTAPTPCCPRPGRTRAHGRPASANGSGRPTRSARWSPRSSSHGQRRSGGARRRSNATSSVSAASMPVEHPHPRLGENSRFEGSPPGTRRGLFSSQAAGARRNFVEYCHRGAHSHRAYYFPGGSAVDWSP